MKDKESRLTIIDELNKSLENKAIENVDIPTVQSIAASIGVTEKMLDRWLHEPDGQLTRELHNITKLKEINEEILTKFPELAWTEEEKRIIAEARGKTRTILRDLQNSFIFSMRLQEQRKDIIS